MRFVVLDHLKIFRVLFELVASKLNIHKQNYQVITTYYIWKSINLFFFQYYLNNYSRNHSQN